MLMLLKEIVSPIKTLRKKRGLNQVDLAKKMGVTQSYISRVEHGEIDISVTRFYEIVRSLESDVVVVPTKHLASVRLLIEQNDGDEENTPLYQLNEEDV